MITIRRYLLATLVVASILFGRYAASPLNGSAYDKSLLFVACAFSALLSETVCSRVVHDGLDWRRPKRLPASNANHATQPLA
jgi:hypothetical protein